MIEAILIDGTRHKLTHINGDRFPANPFGCSVMLQRILTEGDAVRLRTEEAFYIITGWDTVTFIVTEDLKSKETRQT